MKLSFTNNDLMELKDLLIVREALEDPDSTIKVTISCHDYTKREIDITEYTVYDGNVPNELIESIEDRIQQLRDKIGGN